MNIAFLTPEFPTEDPQSGGVGSYIDKMAKCLNNAGHNIHIYVVSHNKTSESYLYNGITVIRIPSVNNIVVKIIVRIFNIIPYLKCGGIIKNIINAWNIAAMLRRKNIKYDIVQSTNYRLTGLFINSRNIKNHFVRISSSRILFDQSNDRKISFGQQINGILEQHIMKKADVVYAPSRLLSDHYSRIINKPVAVVRPPYSINSLEFGDISELQLPERYFVHFGSLCKRKGTIFISKALKLAWNYEPDIKMVLIGVNIFDTFEEFSKIIGSKRNNIVWLGPRDRSIVYSVIKKSVASVLPSRIDNLPNTAIESLTFGIPVIGTKNSSIDEIVEPGINGELVFIDDVESLAHVLVKAWRGEYQWQQAGISTSKIFREMSPDRAVDNFFRIRINDN